MADTGIQKREISIPIIRAYQIALLLIPVVILLFGIPYLLLWMSPLLQKIVSFTHTIFRNGRWGIMIPYLVKGIVSILVGIFLHEMLHGIGWIVFAKKNFRSLHFGFMMPAMAPYAHCKESLPVCAYRVGIILPGFLLGFFPAIFGIVTGSFCWLCYGMFFTWAASGDFIMFWLIRHLKGTTLVMDHPYKLGCIIL
jgi:hypothetical protein